MGQILKVFGGLALLYLGFGSQVTGAIYDRIEYNFGKFRRSDIRIDLREGNVIGKLRLTLMFKQSFGLNLSANRLQLNLRQQDQFLGEVTVNQPVTLPHATTVPIPLDVIVPASDFLDRLQSVLEGKGQWYAPIKVTGTLTLSNGQNVPVFGEIDMI